MFVRAFPFFVKQTDPFSHTSPFGHRPNFRRLTQKIIPCGLFLSRSGWIHTVSGLCSIMIVSLVGHGIISSRHCHHTGSSRYRVRPGSRCLSGQSSSDTCISGIAFLHRDICYNQAPLFCLWDIFDPVAIVPAWCERACFSREYAGFPFNYKRSVRIDFTEYPVLIFWI